MGSTSKYRILLADDTAFFRKAFREALEIASCSVTEAVDGQNAFELLTAPGARYDLLVLDEVMPRLTGSQIVRQLAEKRLRYRTIILTGVRSQQMNLASFPDGHVEAILDKARPIEELIYGVNNILFSKTSEAREWPRVPIKAIAQYKNGGAWRVGRIWDVSHTGLQLRTSEPLSKGFATELKFFLPRVKTPLETRVRVVWARRIEDSGTNPEAHGVVFENLPDPARRELVAYVNERVAEITSGTP